MSTAVVTRRGLALQRAARRGRGFRVLLALVVLALGGAAVYAHEAVRSAEAAASTLVLERLFGYDMYAWRDQIIFKLGPDRFDALALRITAECTSLVVLVPLLLFASGVLVITRVGTGRWLLSVAIAVTMIFAVNVVRIAVIAYSLRELGQDGYAWSHTVIGTAIIAVGTVAAVIAMLAIQAGLRRRVRRG